MMTEHTLDITKLSISEEGIDGFYWPVQAEEVYAIYQRLLHNLIFYIRTIAKQNIQGVDSALILYRFFISEVISIYEAHLLLSRSQKDGIVWTNTETNPWVSLIREGKTPDHSFVIQRLKQGPASLSKIRLPLRFVRDLICAKKEGMIRRSLRSCVYQEDIVSLSLNPLAIQRAKQNENRVYYHREQYWFNRPLLIQPVSNYSVLVDGFLQCVTDAIEGLPGELLDYLKAWLEKAISLSDAYLLQLSRKKIDLKHLWVSTAGHLWGRILARHVKKNGGQVTRFDHGSGCGYFADSHAQGAHDYEDCDVYVTFSDSQARAMRAAFTGFEVVQAKCPKIIASTSQSKSMLSSRCLKPLSIKKVMYVASIYPNGHFYPGAKRFMRSHVLLDWEIRVMSQLRKWGYQVLFKPHPTERICTAPPPSIEKLFGPITLTQNFEDVFEKADLILLDDPTTSLLATLIKSDKPFVYLDFGVAEFSQQALALLKKRCPIVNGDYDKNNRAVMNWFELKCSIESAWQYNDKSFYNYFFRT